VIQAFIFGKIFEFIANYRVHILKSLIPWACLLLISRTRFPEYIPVIIIIGLIHSVTDTALFHAQLSIMGSTINRLNAMPNLPSGMLLSPADFEAWMVKMKDGLDNPEDDSSEEDSSNDEEHE